MQLPDLSILLVMAIFGATFLVLKTFVFRPLGSILEEREARLEEAESALEKMLRREAEVVAELDQKLTSARREVLAAREASRLEAAAERQQTLETARERARVTVVTAQAQLEREIVATREELRRSTEAMARDIASQTLGRKVA